MVALAAEIDAGYRQRYGGLNGDPEQWWPTVDLVLNLTGLTGQERLKARAQLDRTGTLFRMRLLRREGDELPAVQADFCEGSSAG